MSKRYNIMHGIGKAKYVINYHDGIKKHEDGSDFYDIKICKSMKEVAKFTCSLDSKGYKEERV